ncbi:DUF1839 family protein [Rhodococcus sp. ABRD24]|uniref:DUF1839 family protein n=1 Tax=Rhodococcus sp. ABRD24 TaxID=2507582 RepID=UPI0010387955|nr:DUF1839 family protein [Rhodococcus sp. ABRD24]QBJ97628.1 DUF1839 family protein [Rhodococcus sp. ABRD24]
MTGPLLPVATAGYSPHGIHSSRRIWAETNCYVDLWVEILHVIGADPVPAAACAFSSRFDGRQWTFLKFRPEDLAALYGIDVAEMNIWRPAIDHLEHNLDAGMLSTVEVDGFWLPDTAGTSYRRQHVKTTIAPNRIDRAVEELEYFHNSGYHLLRGEDFRCLFGVGDEPVSSFAPYVEQVRFDRRPLLDEGRFGAVLRRHLRTRSPDNPVAGLAARVESDAAWLRVAGMEAFHSWTFGTLRQCGASAELAADVCEFMDSRGYPGAAAAAGGFRAVAEGAKSVQFRMSRVAHGRAVDPRAQLAAMAEEWERSMDIVVKAAEADQPIQVSAR